MTLTRTPGEGQSSPRGREAAPRWGWRRLLTSSGRHTTSALFRIACEQATLQARTRRLWRGLAMAWSASGRGPWRSVLAVLLGFGLPILVLAAHAEVGPERWEQVEGLPASGPVLQLLSGHDEAQPFLYALVGGWGVFRSGDDGSTWQQVDRHLPRGHLGQALVGFLAVAPDDPALLLASLHEDALEGGPVVFKSVDGGGTWLPRRGLGAPAAGALALASDRLAYAAGGNRLYRSADGGDAWFRGGRRPTESAVLAVAVDPVSGALYIGTKGDGLWLTVDEGASWRAGLSGRTVYAVALGEGRRAYAATDDGLYCSADAGATWSRRPAPDGPLVALAVAPGSPDQLFAAPARGPLQHSADGGATWQSLGHTLLNEPITALAVDPTSTGRVYVGTQRGLWRCTLPAELGQQ